MKVTFDLGSVSIYDLPTRKLYRSIQMCLQEVINEDGQSVALDYPRAMEGGMGFEGREEFGYAYSQVCLNPYGLVPHELYT